MKIIQVMPEFGLAGAEKMAEMLTYQLIRSGINVIVVSFYDYQSSITQNFSEKKIPIIYLNKKAGLDVMVMMRFRKICQNEKPDAIHTHRYVLPYVFLATMGMNVKIIHTVHNIAEKEVSSWQQVIQNYLFRLKRIIPVAISPIVKESILKRYKINENMIPMIYNGIDSDLYSPKKEYSLHDGGVILHIGRFNEQKNHRMLILAFEKVVQIFSSCRLILIGFGELYEEINELVHSLHLERNVVFLGLRNDISLQMNDADLFVLPSNYEGMPITLIEAMSIGLPIVATRVGGVPDIISDKNGVLIENGIENLALEILRLLSDKQLRVSLGTQAKKDALRFSAKRMALDYIRLYNT